MNILRIILAIFPPSVAAFPTVGLGLQYWLNLLFVPGVIHAL